MADVRNVSVPTPQFNYKDWTVDVNWTYDDEWTAHHAYVWDVKVNEPITIRENYFKEASCKLKDSFSLTDSEKIVYSFDLNKQTKIKISESLLPQLTFIRKYSESLKVKSVNGNTVELPFNTKFSIYDSLGRSGQGVVSDIIFEQGEWTMDSVTDMMLKGKPAGYTNFMPFIYGDYTYKDAIFRTIMESDGGSKAVIEQYKITVDVPDVTDRGSAEVIDKNYDLRVKFNKTFLTAPEVVVTMRSGASGAPIAPYVVAIDEKGFDVHLLNAITGQKTTGKFIWTATGY